MIADFFTTHIADAQKEMTPDDSLRIFRHSISQFDQLFLSVRSLTCRPRALCLKIRSESSGGMTPWLNLAGLVFSL